MQWMVYVKVIPSHSLTKIFFLLILRANIWYEKKRNHHPGVFSVCLTNSFWSRILIPINLEAFREAYTDFKNNWDLKLHSASFCVQHLFSSSLMILSIIKHSGV